MPGWHAVMEKDLPVKLPHIKDFRPTGTEKSPLAIVEKFFKVRCPKCKSWARRETDVCDTFLDSSWYYIGYLMASENLKIQHFHVWRENGCMWICTSAAPNMPCFIFYMSALSRWRCVIWVLSILKSRSRNFGPMVF